MHIVIFIWVSCFGNFFLQNRGGVGDVKGTHPAVFIDGPQPFHGHISDMAPPKQDLPWNKVGKTDLGAHILEKPNF